MFTPTLRLVFGDQLTENLASLQDAVPQDVILMMEVRAEGTYVPHHPQKIVLILAAMRQFAAQLEAKGLQVRYVRLDDPANTHTFATEIVRALNATRAQRVLVTWPGEWRVLNELRMLQANLPVPLEILEDTRFVASMDDFANWAAGRKQLRMEYFYREQRQRTGLLMCSDGTPEGKQWNFDAENRLPYRDGALTLPTVPMPQEGPSTREVVEEIKKLVEVNFSGHFGNLEPFKWATTRAGALQVLESFLAERLPNFGRYQDAMLSGGDFMFHSLISPYLNIGLLDPLKVCRAAEAEYYAGRASLAAVEGFVRQIVGWREYVRGLYWHLMPGYQTHNFFDARRPLPALFWDESKTDMQCLRDCIGTTRRNAYAHHIQRLMVIGNFALLAGLDVTEVTGWYLAVYADAFEWVELPNTLGMALFADGGEMASKPYAASGRYINNMSDYCQTCRYDPTQSLGPKACPMTTLYWDFMLRHEAKLARNPRLGMIMAQVRRMPEVKRVQIQTQAEAFLNQVAPLPLASSEN